MSLDIQFREEDALMSHNDQLRFLIDRLGLSERQARARIASQNGVYDGDIISIDEGVLEQRGNSDVSSLQGFPTLLYDEHEIRRKVYELGEQISAAYPKLESPLLVIGVLKGAFLFSSDLVRAIRIPLEFDYIEASSYVMDPSCNTAAMQSSGKITMAKTFKDLRMNLAGRHVLLVDDIIDTGRTMQHLFDDLISYHPASIAGCVLLDKKHERRQFRPEPLSFRGFEIEDRFVVGYGMDLKERYRNLPYIGVLDKAA